MSISIPAAYKLIVPEEVKMFTQPTTELVQWQDFKVISEVDLVLETAQQNGWKDCEVFGHGDMITKPMESLGWKLIPADLYEYSIPAEGVERILQIINAGVRIQGVIIADDQRRTNPPAIPARPKISLPSVEKVVTFILSALMGLIVVAGTVAMMVVAVFFAPLLIIGLIFGTGVVLDPKLIILVDDGNGGTAWVSVLTWFD
jgi:hypothetical protein